MNIYIYIYICTRLNKWVQIFAFSHTSYYCRKIQNTYKFHVRCYFIYTTLLLLFNRFVSFRFVSSSAFLNRHLLSLFARFASTSSLCTTHSVCMSVCALWSLLPCSQQFKAIAIPIAIANNYNYTYLYVAACYSAKYSAISLYIISISISIYLVSYRLYI